MTDKLVALRYFQIKLKFINVRGKNWQSQRNSGWGKDENHKFNAHEVLTLAHNGGR